MPIFTCEDNKDKHFSLGAEYMFNYIEKTSTI